MEALALIHIVYYGTNYRLQIFSRLYMYMYVSMLYRELYMWEELHVVTDILGRTLYFVTHWGRGEWYITFSEFIAPTYDFFKNTQNKVETKLTRSGWVW